MARRKTRALLSVLIVLCMLITSIAPGAVAFAEKDAAENLLKNTEEDVYKDYPTDPKEYQVWKEGLARQNTKLQEGSGNFEIRPMSLNGNMMFNDYIETYIADDGTFTMGTTGGNPNISSDDNQNLLFGHPSPWSSITLIRINDEDTFFIASSHVFNADGTQCIATGMIDDVEVKQVVTFEANPYTSRQDVMSIKYILTNEGSTAKDIGGRIMLDTQLGENDGAPFRVPGVGDVTTEMEFVGSAIPQYWQAFDNLTNPGVIASGTFYRTASEKPDKVQFAHWGSIFNSYWDYQVTNDKSITGDSAVAAYFNPKLVPAGQSRTIVTYYGLSDFAFGDLTGELGARITAPSSLQVNASGTAYMDNPFTVTAYIANQTAGTLSNVKAKLNLPEGLILTGTESATTNIGNLPSGAERQVSWQVWAVPQSTGKTLNYSINITSSSVSKDFPMSISLPRANYMTVNSLFLNKTSLAMTAGKTEKLTATIRTGTSDIVAQKYEVRWETTNPRVAIVSPDGTVRAVSNGTATIKAISADNRKTASCAVTVAPRMTTEVDLWTLSSLAYRNFTNADKGKALSTFNSFGNWTAISTPSKTDHVKTVLGGFVVDNVMNDSRTSFYGVSFKDQNNGVVIAYRGSNDPMISWSGIGKDWLDDAAFGAFDNLPEQFYQALQFYRQVKADNPDKKIWLTGHSLGGALGAFVSIMEDAEAIVFNAPSGLIIDLTYFINANYIDHFKGIDKWNFKNHYNSSDLVGNRNPHLYRSVAHAHNNHNGALSSSGFNPHNLESLVTVTNGKIALTSGSGENNYKNASNWERVLNSFNNPGYGVLNQLGMNSNHLNGGRLGRVMLGKSSGNQTITFPDNLVEVRRNVMFMGGGGTIANGTSSWWGDYYYLSKSGTETVYGRSGDDTYVVFNKGNNTAWIFDASGNDTIWYKDAAMSEIMVTTRSDGHYTVKAGGTGSLIVDKNRSWLQPKIVIKDKNGATKKITEFSRARMAPLAEVTLFSEEEGNINEDLRTVKIDGSNLNIEILDENKVLLGTFNNSTDKVDTTEFALVFMKTGENPMIEVDLINNGRFIKVSGTGNISYSVFDLSAAGEDSVFYELKNIDLSGNATLLVDNKAFAATLSKNGIGNPITPTEYKLPTSIEATSASLEIYAGQSKTIPLTFQPLNVVSKEVDIDVSGNPDTIFVMPKADGAIEITAREAGKSTITVSSPFDPNVKATIAVTVRQDEAPEIEATTANGQAYAGGNWAEDEVTVNFTLPSGYDKKYFHTGMGFMESANGVVVNTNGINNVYAYAQDSTNNKITKIAQIEVKYDDQAPGILNVENDQEYYIDKCVLAYDENLRGVTINGTSFNELELNDGKWIIEPGQYQALATDLSGKETTVNFTIKSMPDVDSLTKEDAELLTLIRHEFEDDKYLLFDERREELSRKIYALERKLAALQNENSSEAEITGFNVEGQLEPEIIDVDNGQVTILVRSDIDLSNIRPIIGISDGAQISPSPFVAQNFESPVTYTVIAADATEKSWQVAIQKHVNTTKPVLQGIETAGNLVALEFDAFMDSNISQDKIKLLQQNGAPVISGITSHLVNEKVINIGFDIDLPSLTAGEYSLLLKSGAVKSIDGLFNDETSMAFNIEGLSQVAIPTTNVTPGMVSKGTKISLSSATAGAEIYYTTDGSTPTADSIPYSSPIAIDQEVTIKAIAVKSNMTNSNIAIFSYTISTGGPDTNTGGGGGGGYVPTQPSNSFKDGNSTYVKGLKANLVHLTDKDFKQFSQVKIDGANLEKEKDYKVENSSTKVTIYADYLETLSVGQHTLAVHFTDGVVVSARFTVEAGKSITTPELFKNLFSDVKEKDWFYKDVAYVYENGLMAGTSENPMMFSPKMPLTRGMVVTVLYRIEDSPSVSGLANPFDDVEEGKWYTDGIKWAAANDIVSGFGQGKFGAKDNITREQMAVILANYEMFSKKFPPDTIAAKEFSDGHIISSWAKDAVGKLTRQGIIGGKSGDLFDPKGETTRAEVAAMLHRFLTAIE